MHQNLGFGVQQQSRVPFQLGKLEQSRMTLPRKIPFDIHEGTPTSALLLQDLVRIYLLYTQTCDEAISDAKLSDLAVLALKTWWV